MDDFEELPQESLDFVKKARVKRPRRPKATILTDDEDILDGLHLNNPIPSEDAPLGVSEDGPESEDLFEEGLQSGEESLLSSAKLAKSSLSNAAAAAAPSTPSTVGTRQTAVKRKKQMRPIAENMYKYVQVPTDPQSGKPILPFVIGLHTVHSLGEIVWERAAFHNNRYRSFLISMCRYIFPAGFHSSRQYPSIRDPSSQTTWHSRIIDDGSANPVFEVTAEDDPEHPLTGSTSTGVWSSIMRQAAALRKREPAGSASGPDFYGLGCATIMFLIEHLPNAERCAQYERKRYELMTGFSRRSAAIPLIVNKGSSLDLSTPAAVTLSSSQGGHSQPFPQEPVQSPPSSTSPTGLEDIDLE